jgi:hypothetical protein
MPSCEICKKDFTRGDNLKRHVREIHHQFPRHGMNQDKKSQQTAIPTTQQQQHDKITTDNYVGPNEMLEAEVILSAIPKYFRNRAQSLLNHIWADPQHTLQWNDRGELIVKGVVIPGSHITDLLKNSLQPLGQKEFHEGLKELNIPLGLLESAPPAIKKDTWLHVKMTS